MKTLCLAIMVLFAAVAQSQPLPGQPIGSYKIIKRDSQLYVLTGPSQYEKAVEIYHDAIKYSVVLNEMKNIKFVQTADANFRVQEGVAVGSPYSEVKKLKGSSQVIEYKGWGKIIMLKSGWYAVFDFKDPLVPTSPIQFFFKPEMRGQ